MPKLLPSPPFVELFGDDALQLDGVVIARRVRQDWLDAPRNPL